MWWGFDGKFSHIFSHTLGGQLIQIGVNEIGWDLCVFTLLNNELCLYRSHLIPLFTGT